MIKVVEEESALRSTRSTEGVPRGKFILIDHSIKGFGGHHYEYAVHVLNAAKELGFEPILAVNRAFKVEHDAKTPWKIIPAYEHGFWPEPETAPSSWMTALKRAAFNLRVKLVYSRIGLFRATLVHLRSLQLTDESIRQAEQAHLTGGLLIMRFLITYPHLVLKSLWQFVREVFSFIPSSFYHYVGNVWSAFVNVWRQVGYPLKAFKFIKVRRNQSRRSGQIKAFERDTRHLFTTLCSVDDGDLVFVPTLSEQDMLGLGRFLKHNQNARSASWHLLFRRNLFLAPASDRGDAGDNHRLLDARSSFDSFKTTSNGIDVRFYTDTERLTNEYDQIGAVRFRTLPIPINPEFSTNHIYRSDPGILQVTYAGDARVEKGYHYLADIVKDLWAHGYKDRVHFRFQSNLAQSRPEDGTMESLVRTELKMLDPNRVQLKCEALDSKAYFELVSSAHILLLLYDANSYYSRSSGILVEALANGIPVVVPAGSWMGLQIAEAQYHYLSKLEREENHTVAVYHAYDLDWMGDSRTSGPSPSREPKMCSQRHSEIACTLSHRPKGATHLIVSFDRPEGMDMTVLLYLVQVMGEIENIDASSNNGMSNDLYTRIAKCYPGATITRKLLPPSSYSDRCYALIPLDDETDAVWLAFSNAYSDISIPIENMKATYLCCEGNRLDTDFVGIAYLPGESISRHLENMIDHYEHFHATAIDYSSFWKERHSAECLVRDLV